MTPIDPPQNPYPIPAADSFLPLLSDLWQTTLGWQPDAPQQDLFQQLYEGILQGNRQLNLTRITEPAEFWEKHLWDSLRGISCFLPNLEIKGEKAGQAIADPENLAAAQVIDIGTGAGFPGIPVAIVRPTWNVTLLDSTRKKIQFLNQLLADLNVTNTRTLVDRVENVGQQPHHREAYDIAMIRAVATAPVCAEYTLPLLKQGGIAILYRGQWTEQESEALESAVQILGGQLERVEQFKTPLTDGDRHCLYLRKVEPTPQEFPRSVGIPAQKPL